MLYVYYLFVYYLTSYHIIYYFYFLPDAPLKSKNDTKNLFNIENTTNIPPTMAQTCVKNENNPFPE
jgi:hypothetical protein